MNPFSTKSQNGKLLPSYNQEEMNGEKILMGIMHTSWPHYGLQVGFSFQTSIFIYTSGITKL